MSEPVIVSAAGGVAEIRFNRPERLNALDVELVEGFASSIARVTADPSIRVIVVSSEGRAFVAGGDLAHFHRATDKPAAVAHLIDPIHAALKTLDRAPQIVIGSIKGAVRRFVNLHKDFDPDDGEITRVHKLRRNVIEDRYAPVIEAMYGRDDTVVMTTKITYDSGNSGISQYKLRIRTL